jgi:hypothetical protein
MLIFGMIVGASISSNAAPIKVPDAALTGGSFILAQTPGMERREERRSDRQDCRQQNGLVGQAKRNCKQNARQQRNQ